MFSFLAKLFGWNKAAQPEERVERMRQIKERARGTNEIGLSQLKKGSKSSRPSDRPVKIVVLPDKDRSKGDSSSRDSDNQKGS